MCQHYFSSTGKCHRVRKTCAGCYHGVSDVPHVTSKITPASKPDSHQQDWMQLWVNKSISLICIPKDSQNIVQLPYTDTHTKYSTISLRPVLNRPKATLWWATGGGQERLKGLPISYVLLITGIKKYFKVFILKVSIKKRSQLILWNWQCYKEGQKAVGSPSQPKLGLPTLSCI